MTDWANAGAADPTAGKRTIREQLEASGLVLDTAEYHRAFDEFRRGQASARAARQAAAEERERQRVAPCLAEARAAVLSWGCVEDGSSTAEEIEDMVADEATRLADEADEAAREAAERAGREEAELADYLRRQAGLRAAVAAVIDAAAEAGWRLEERRCSHDSSRYYWLLRGGDPDAVGDYDEAVSLRISDHHAKNGSGWNEAKQEHHDAPDINIVIRRGADGEYAFDLAPLVETIGQ